MRYVAAVVLVALVACDRGGGRTDRPPEPPASPRAESASTPPFSIVPASAPCRVGEACKVGFRVLPRDGHHVNAEYPFKLVLDATHGVTFLGEAPEERVFSKASGAYTSTGPHEARLDARFRAEAPGKVRVAGTLKLSVCSDESCFIESPHVEADVDVAP